MIVLNVNSSDTRSGSTAERETDFVIPGGGQIQTEDCQYRFCFVENAMLACQSGIYARANIPGLKTIRIFITKGETITSGRVSLTKHIGLIRAIRDKVGSQAKVQALRCGRRR